MFLRPSCRGPVACSARCKKGIRGAPRSRSASCKSDSGVAWPYFFSVVSVNSVVKFLTIEGAKFADGFLCSRQYSLAEHSERRAGGDARQCFGGRRYRGSEKSITRRMPRQNLYHAANQVIRVGFRDFHARHVSGCGCFPGRELDISEVKLAVNVRRHALQARFPDQRVVFRGAFDHRGSCAALETSHLLARDLLLNGHQAIAALRDRFRVHFFVQRVAACIVHVGIRSRARSCELSRSEEHTSELQSPDHLVCR